MIIRLNSEANLVKATEVKLIKTSDYQDTLTFKLPLDEKIFVDELVGVRTKVMKQDYRVKEIITKDRFKDVYCEHKFFDCKNIVIPFVDEAHRAGESYNDFSRYNSLQSIVAHLNRIMRTKGDTEFKFSTEVDKSGVVECDDTPLFDLIFGEKGILKTFNVELVYDNYKVKFVEKRPSKNTEILFHENKNVSELQETVDFKEIVTKLHITCKYTPDKTEEGRAERERLRAEKRRELFNKSQEKIKARETRQAEERALRRQKQEEAYQASRTAPKKTREQIHAEHLRKQQETESRILANNEARRVERERKFNERELQRVSRAQDKEDLIFRTVFVSPLVNRYARPYEASLNFQSTEINSEEALIAWCNANLFTDEDTRDVPLRNFSFKPVEDNYNVDINDRAMVNFTSIGTTKIVHCCKIEYDALHDKYLNIEFGVLNKSAIRETIGALNAKISETNSNISRTYDILDKNFDDYVQKELEAYAELFNIDKGEIDEAINQGFEDAKIDAEKVYGNINTDIENKLAPIRNQVSTTVENYNRQFQATNLEISKNRVEATKQIQALSDRVNNIQDISNNETVRELRGLVNGATSKVTELQDSITREFTAVKKKNEDGLSAVKAEFTKGVDGLTSKVSSLEEYKNQDGTRTESLKQWVQRDTANQLSRERTEITRIVDSKGFVKNTEFSSKFNDNAQGINRKLDALETYKNQDGTRTSALKQWTQENTANQLVTARRNIENWVDTKGYVTNSVLNNKVQETASSFSREISNVRNSIPTSVGGRNYIIDSNKLNTKQFYSWNKWEKSTSGNELVLIKIGGSDTYGFWFNLTDLVKTQFQNEELTWSIDIKASRNMTLNNVGFETNGRKKVNITTEWQRISHTFINKFTNVFAFVFYNPTANFNNGDKIHIKLPKLEKGNVATDWTPAPEDNQQSISELNTWKQTANQTLNTVTSTLNDTVRHAQLRIGADKIDFGSNKVFDGRNLASMLSVSPESIQAITDRLVISPANENLVKSEFRNRHALGGRDVFLNRIYAGNELAGDYYFAADITAFDAKELKAMIHVKYTDGTNEYLENKFPSTDFFGGTQETTVKVPLKSNKTIEFIEPIIFQPRWSNFDSYILGNIKVYKKKSAELIVDGTIEGKHIKSSTIETGHLKAGSVTSNIIAAEAIKSTHLKVDDAMIRDLVSHKAFVTKLWAQDAFIKTLQATKIQSTQISTETLRGVTIEGAKFLVGRTGILDTSDSVLRFSTPFEWGGTSGVGMQLRGRSDGHFNQGLNIYRVNDVRNPNTPLYTPDEVALTVFGEIRGAFKINSLPKSKSLTSRMGVAVMSNISSNTPIQAQGYPGAVLYQIRSIFLRSGGGPTQIWVNDGTGGNSTFGVNVANMESDIKLKENISISNHSGLDVIKKFTFHSFDWKKDKFGYRKPHTKIGLIAQEVQEIQDDLVYKNPNALALDEFRLLNIALKAIQELSQENTNLKSQLKEMNERLSKLETLQQ